LATTWSIVVEAIALRTRPGAVGMGRCGRDDIRSVNREEDGRRGQCLEGAGDTRSRLRAAEGERLAAWKAGLARVLVRCAAHRSQKPRAFDNVSRGLRLRLGPAPPVSIFRAA